MSENCLIIGLGKIGLSYDLDNASAIFSHSRAISKHPFFKLLGAVDPCPIQRSIFQKHYNRPAFEDVASSMKELHPSLVVIASPTETHLNVINQVLSQFKPKTIICEKPLSYDLTEAHEIVDTCNREGVNLFVNYPRRSDPGVIEIKKRIDEGKICLPMKGMAWYSKGFIHNGSHYFNLLEFWLGKYIGFKVIDLGHNYDDLDLRPNVEISYENGSVVFMSAWEDTYCHSTLELLSQSGRLTYERNSTTLEWQPVVSDPSFAGYNTLDPSIELIHDGSKQYQWHVFNQLAEYFAGNQSSLCTGRQALTPLQAVQEMTRGKL